ncbi:MAG: hypothetical protein RI575_06670 [Balneolaceae bacterium]|nr:hypothetical protein [Balneolaceae bacterium]MDR9408422.1 hypothetical protein [Balneolaceae bacterium]
MSRKNSTSPASTAVYLNRGVRRDTLRKVGLEFFIRIEIDGIIS